MAVPRRGGNAGDGGTGGPVSPFIRRDKYRRNFLRARQSGKGTPISVKKEDPDAIHARESRLLGVEIANGSNGSGASVKREGEVEEYNEFPLRAISREKLENMRTHLLKFQSKKKIDFETSFHEPIRLHRKDTRNLQFQLTRAEIVQRQKEIAEYKRQQEDEKKNGGINTQPSTYPGKLAQAPTLGSTSTPAGSLTPGVVPKATTPAEPNGTPGSSTAVPNVPNGVSGPVPNEDGSVPIVTQLEEAGISEHPEKVGMVKYDGKEEAEAEFAPGTTDPFADVAPDGGGRARRINPKRKTRQLKVLDENAKKLRFEEFYPWVMEDYDGYNTWVGSYEAGNSDSYVMLSVEDDGSFTMIPADKVYKFTARNKYATLTIDEAEKRMDKKAGEVPRWLMKHLDNIGTTTTRYDRTKRRLKAVSDQHGAEGEEEHGDNSEVELDYDEEFADDEEAPIIDGNEQENKESEERIKKEMLQANAMGLRDEDQGSGNEEDDLFTEKKIDVEGERIKKALQKTELAALYSSDDDEINPYLSESDLEKEESSKGEEEKKDKDKADSPKKGRSPQIKRERSPSVKSVPPIKVKSINDCFVILKSEKSVLQNFPQGEWNPTTKRVREVSEIHTDSNSPAPIVKQEEPEAKKVKVENGNEITPLISEQDIIDAIGDGKVNVKDFGKTIRKRFPGSENKKLMFAIVKKLCRKVDNEHMELKK
ncbi:transcription factor IIF subunit TFG1 KNAG_0H02580 [Huiozyma naganishii CBS 8797]|uniref:Transcription initiation factor IIF subunit alpha n=1 Tax=Huiozyma naganishii (strain ATCC MYA-139 / BCRC 22969 / CBS 8797 / KCTC 17520 / NBRC 10181 / NCYC 3082 / Yp74L-3) TaxID=1071383 RepID=J7RPL6_HUIN7|nr:hypothetical protein KNAG_0H02580 [Kazachstania naganishii CBS 8797]CCK71673.1 hypothetical protein KNAG_0H02580 [Kazachstania naganishii CBS 8797]